MLLALDPTPAFVSVCGDILKTKISYFFYFIHLNFTIVQTFIFLFFSVGLEISIDL